MTTRLNPYLGFRANAREAMEFYQGVFGGKLDVSTFGEFGGAPEGLPDDGVMHAHLETPQGFVLMASDTPPEMPVPDSSNISISLSGDAGDGETMKEWFAALADGGSVTMPLARQMWGDDFGMCVDRFGVAWMVNIAGEQSG